jgi:hypothetical protein
MPCPMSSALTTNQIEILQRIRRRAAPWDAGWHIARLRDEIDLLCLLGLLRSDLPYGYKLSPFGETYLNRTVAPEPDL